MSAASAYLLDSIFLLVPDSLLAGSLLTLLLDWSFSKEIWLALTSTFELTYSPLAEAGVAWLQINSVSDILTKIINLFYN